MSRRLSSAVTAVLLDGLAPSAADRAAEILVACPFLDLDAAQPYFRPSFAAASLLVVEDGFVVLRAKAAGDARTMIICEGGPGRLVLPPTDEEVLVGLASSRLIVVSPAARRQLLAIEGVAEILFAQLARTLQQKQERIGTFGITRHRDRVRRVFLQLAQSYGKVAPDGIRIDFPVSHLVLAEMVGSSRETVTRAVDELQRDGFVARRGHRYRLLVPPESLLDEV
jgi:hypothetical protein